MSTTSLLTHARSAEGTRRQVLLYLTPLLAMAAVACNPPEVDPDPPPGPFTFVLVEKPNALPVFFRTFGAGPTYAFGKLDVGVFDPLKQPGPSYPFRASLISPGTRVDAPLEAQMFVRDPDEVPQLLNNVTDQDAFLAELLNIDRATGFHRDLVTYPDSIAVPYPVPQHKGHSDLDPLTPLLFGAPDTAQIQAIRFVQDGLCSAKIDYNFLFGLAKGQIAARLGASCDILDVLRVDWLTLASALRHNADQLLDSRGQFLLNGGGFAKGSLLGVSLGTCTFQFNQIYESSLQDGIINVTPTKPALVTVDSGGICHDQWVLITFPLPGAQNILEYELNVDVPTSINRIVSSVQSFSGKDIGFQGWDCDPTKITPTGPPAQDGCDDARAAFRQGITSGSAILGIADQSPEQLDLIAAADAIKPDGHFRNWSCVATSATDATAGKCAYALRARRLIPNPDNVELVWFDNFKDFTNPALAFYYFATPLFALKPSLRNNFCQPTHAQRSSTLQADGKGYYYRRPFAVSTSSPAFECPHQ